MYTQHRQKHKLKKTRRPVSDIRITLPEKKAIISKLHQLNKLQNSRKTASSENGQHLHKLQQECDKIGGLDAYQFVSKTTEYRYGNFNSAKWVVKELKKHRILPEKGSKLKLLDVGALDLNYKGQGHWIESTAIDLNPQKAGIEKADFLNYKTSCQEVYDVVILSLVLNFSGDAAKRGDMLHRAQSLCKTAGVICIVLPLACVSNSRYLTHPHLEAMLSSLGFDLISSHDSRKLSFKFLRKTSRSPTKQSFPKTKLHEGTKRNNFCIVLR